MTDPVTKEDGRRIFGLDAVGYDEARPPYPLSVFDYLSAECGLKAGTATLEIGPGTGKATGELIARGASPLVGVEPDPALAAFLRARFEIDVIEAPFETCTLAQGDFDLAVCATAFHWLDEPASLARIASGLRSGGSWAMWWWQFGLPGRLDEFQKATDHLFAEVPNSPSHGTNSPFSDDHAARQAALAAGGFFAPYDFHRIPVDVVMTTQEICALYATFSGVRRLESGRRARFLGAVAEVSERSFQGRAMRQFNVPIYAARRL